MSKPGPVSVLIVDDEDDMRSLLRLLIEDADAGLTVSGEAADGPAALLQWEETRPSVIVLDNRMPGMDGLTVAAQILREQPEQQIVLFTAHLDEATSREATRLGVSSCLSKTQVDEVAGTIRRLATAG